jgi:hypothetical protein
MAIYLMMEAARTSEMTVNFNENTRRYVRLGGLVASVLATGPKGRGLEPGQGDGFFKGDKNPQHTLLRLESKAGGPVS